MHRIILIIATALLGVSSVSGQVQISEFVAGNKSSLIDEDGDSSDWIEIFNDGDLPVNLENWHLTDDPELPGKWQFPAVTISSKAFIIIFASGKDRSDPDGPLHTNFRLSTKGEYLALIQSDGVTAEHAFEPEYPEQFTDISYGLGQNVARQYLLTRDDFGAYLVPQNGDLNYSWVDPDFDDVNWPTAAQPVGYQSSVPGFLVRNIKSSIEVTDLARAETVISSPALQSTVTTVIASQINYVGTGGGGHYSNNRSFPGMNGGGDINNFVVEATATITIPSAGSWTFGVNSDDGFGLDIGDQRLAFPNSRGPADSLATFQFEEAGDFELRLVYFERGGLRSNSGPRKELDLPGLNPHLTSWVIPRKVGLL